MDRLTLYRSALRLWDVHRELEDWLHQRVCNMFQLEEKILLLDITNAYFEGRMENSDLRRKRSYPTSIACSESIHIRWGKKNPWYTQSHPQKIPILRINQLHEIYLQHGLMNC